MSLHFDSLEEGLGLTSAAAAVWRVALIRWIGHFFAKGYLKLGDTGDGDRMMRCPVRLQLRLRKEIFIRIWMWLPARSAAPFDGLWRSQERAAFLTQPSHFCTTGCNSRRTFLWGIARNCQPLATTASFFCLQKCLEMYEEANDAASLPWCNTENVAVWLVAD